jgi:hypothetical protein
MTAATMKCFLKKEILKAAVEFAHLVSKLFRSQFIAFVGNVFFPFRCFADYLRTGCIFSQNLAIERSDKLLKDLDPLNPKLFFTPVLQDFIFSFQDYFRKYRKQFGVLSDSGKNCEKYFHQSFIR